MGTREQSMRLVSILGPPVVVVASAYAFYLLPVQAETLLLIWMLASLPIGVLFGHCVLSEE
jgi:CBS-domain-containing membrane protein